MQRSTFLTSRSHPAVQAAAAPRARVAQCFVRTFARQGAAWPVSIHSAIHVTFVTGLARRTETFSRDMITLRAIHTVASAQALVSKSANGTLMVTLGAVVPCRALTLPRHRVAQGAVSAVTGPHAAQAKESRRAFVFTSVSVDSLRALAATGEAVASAVVPTGAADLAAGAVFTFGAFFLTV